MSRSERIIGIDVARAFAVIGMIIVNFKVVFGSEGEGYLLTIVDGLSGKAAALFVVLAGVGIALMTKSSIDSKGLIDIQRKRFKLIKRSLILFFVGLSYMAIWPADILHFYGVYMLFTLLFIRSSNRIILWSALGFILLYPLLMWLMDYDLGWNFETLEYQGFWTAKGFIRNLFFNGFHPVFPWTAFMLIGLWYGRHDLRNSTIVKRLLTRGLIGFVSCIILSKVLLLITQSTDPIENEQLAYIFGLSPMPPLPIYMLAGSFLSIAIISICILIGDRYRNSTALKYLVNCGRLALTLYVLHVLVGMGLAIAYDESMISKHSINFTFCYAMVFSILSIVFANVWLHYFKSGPLEWLFKKIVG